VEHSLRQFIDAIREDGSDSGKWVLPGRRTPLGIPAGITVGLARFQSYRRRTEAALIQELLDYIEETGVNYLSYSVDSDEGVVDIW
jgi:hypothetical protein